MWGQFFSGCLAIIKKTTTTNKQPITTAKIKLKKTTVPTFVI